MNRKRLLTICILIIGNLMITFACGSATAVSDSNVASQVIESDDHADDMRHEHVEAPEEFANLSNPYDDNHEAIEIGAELFSTYCASCHGETGKGDGPAAEALDPKPASLSDGAMMVELSDGYLFWRVSTGGVQEPFSSAMPGWDGNLTEDQRWQVISYLRTLSNDKDDHMDEEHMPHGEHVEDDDH